MNKTIRVLGVFALAAILTFSMAACSNGSTSSGDNTGTTVGGEKLTLTGQPVETNGITVTDFSYRISDYINGEASVKIVNGKVNINLGTPKPGVMYYLFDDLDAPGITITPSDAKCFDIEGFEAYDGKHGIYCAKDDNNYAMLVYVDKRVTINGTGTYGYDDYAYTQRYNNVTLNKGWNYLVLSYNEATRTDTITASTMLPVGFKWKVILL